MFIGEECADVYPIVTTRAHRNEWWWWRVERVQKVLLWFGINIGIGTGGWLRIDIFSIEWREQIMMGKVDSLIILPVCIQNSVWSLPRRRTLIWDMELTCNFLVHHSLLLSNDEKSEGLGSSWFWDRDLGDTFGSPKKLWGEEIVWSYVFFVLFLSDAVTDCWNSGPELVSFPLTNWGVVMCEQCHVTNHSNE